MLKRWMNVSSTSAGVENRRKVNQNASAKVRSGSPSTGVSFSMSTRSVPPTSPPSELNATSRGS